MSKNSLREGETKMTTKTPAIVLKNITKYYGGMRALNSVDFKITPGEVTCILGDNGAGKSTLIKIISGLHQADEGTMEVDGKEVQFHSPREALDAGIATVYQDLAVVDLMETWRNFFLGSEMRKNIPLLRPLDVKQMRQIAKDQLDRFGIHLTNINQIVGTLSGGQRQCVSITRAVYFGAKVLILDEPTAALGVKQSCVVLNYVARARTAGLAVVFITHNPHHAYLIGDHFVILKLGKVNLDARRSEISSEQLIKEMAGGEELTLLAEQLDTGSM
jgi:simple sugar transport system ATP-binding protein